MNSVRLLLIVVLVALLCNLTFGQGPPLPVEVQRLDANAYARWADAFNRYQYDLAAELATHEEYSVTTRSAQSIISGGGIYYDSYVNPYGYYQEPTVVNSYDADHTRTYKLNRYGGGPVWIFNPYCPPKR